MTDRKVSDRPGSKAAQVPAPSPHGPDCSPEAAEDAFRLLEGRWKLAILYHLFGGAGQPSPVKRFSELERAIPAISQKMLIQQLRGLERDGIVRRTVHAEVPPRVEYRLTGSGEALRPTLHSLLAWAASRTDAEG